MDRQQRRVNHTPDVEADRDGTRPRRQPQVLLLGDPILAHGLVVALTEHLALVHDLLQLGVHAAGGGDLASHHLQRVGSFELDRGGVAADLPLDVDKHDTSPRGLNTLRVGWGGLAPPPTLKRLAKRRSASAL